MREIKFKAKQLNSGEWFEGDLVHLGNRVCIGGDNIKDGITDVDPETVCQFTGLTDCEGNEVWEGDILEGPNIGEICFNQGAFLIHSIYDNALYSLSNYTTWDGKITCKVIGNKFDNKK